MGTAHSWGYSSTLRADLELLGTSLLGAKRDFPMEHLGLTRTADAQIFCGPRRFSSLQLGDENGFEVDIQLQKENEKRQVGQTAKGFLRPLSTHVPSGLIQMAEQHRGV